jgi:hypothetical protein
MKVIMIGKIKKITFIAIIALLIVVLYYYFFHKQENFGVMVTDAFSNLRCISDNLPIVRLIDNKSIQCLSKSGGNTENCMMRSDFKIPDNVKCNDINTYLSKDGIRNKNSPAKGVYDTLQRDVDYNLLTCNPDGLNDAGHWCGKTFNVIKNEKCTSVDGNFGFWKTPCEKIKKYAELSPVGSPTLTTTKSEILEVRAEGKLNSDIARNKALCGGTQPCRDVLSLASGKSEKCTFTNEGNGNVSIFDKRTNKKVWESGTAGKGMLPYKVVLQTDGNMILQDKDNSMIWESGARGTSNSKLYRANLLEDQKLGHCFLEIRDKDGNFIWKTQPEQVSKL